MTDTQTLIKQGNDAESLLKNETFTGVFNHLIDQCISQSMTTAPEEREKRENLYFQARGLQEVVSTLNSMVAIRDQIIFNREQEE